MHMVGCVCAWNFGTKLFLRRGECKTRENSNFLKKGKIVILAENLEFLYISDDETDFSVEIVSRNLATTSNFVRFRGGRDFTFFEAGVSDDTWQGWGCHMAS